MDNDWDFDGECPMVDVYEPEELEEPVIIYDHNGNAFTRRKICVGFDLTTTS